jgi:hypothetical protein
MFVFPDLYIREYEIGSIVPLFMPAFFSAWHCIALPRTEIALLIGEGTEESPLREREGNHVDRETNSYECDRREEHRHPNLLSDKCHLPYC